MITVWAPHKHVVEDTELLRRVDKMVYDGRAPFDSSIIELLGIISKRILSSPILRSQAQFVALAYWLRPAALSRMIDNWGVENQYGYVRSPRGIAMHLPPTNVDTIFVYSLAVSVLAGNCNIVRMPSKVEPAVEVLVGEINLALSEVGDTERHLFFSFNHDADINIKFSSIFIFY